MKPVAVEVHDPEAWNALVASFRHHSPLQGWGFGEVKAVTGWRPHRLRIEREGEAFACAQVLRRREYGLSFLYAPRGPALNDPADLEDAGVALRAWAGGSEDRKSVV